MNLEVLVSTMNRSDAAFANKMNINSDLLIINQSTKHCDNFEENNRFNIRMLSYSEKGLSKSRNRALENAKGDICLIADDDVSYNNDYSDKIIKAHEDYKDYDIIVFSVPTSNISRKKSYYSKKKKMGYLRSLKIASFEISFKRKSIIDNNIYFNEKFGAGSGQYSMGEENIFLYQCLKKGLKILYLPIEIGIVTHEESTWFNGFNEKLFWDKGAIYYEMSRYFSIPLILQFAFRKYRLYINEISIRKAIKYMLKGRAKYINELKDK
ncbi:glycosyltransferase family 2 protein [Bacillus niameyensis]|uniref:glycosyltransferase family 2 protein n=1 Tax=Bacillus niameyensis TaxID=1522308 RepID=UPI0007835931|nr:glycosyltransferase family A protein [Bacillus niameyensis]